MVSTHAHEPGSPLSMAVGVIFAPAVVLGVLFLIAKAIVG